MTPPHSKFPLRRPPSRVVRGSSYRVDTSAPQAVCWRFPQDQHTYPKDKTRLVRKEYTLQQWRSEILPGCPLVSQEAALQSESTEILHRVHELLDSNSRPHMESSKHCAGPFHFDETRPVFLITENCCACDSVPRLINTPTIHKKISLPAGHAPKLGAAIGLQAQPANATAARSMSSVVWQRWSPGSRRLSTYSLTVRRLSLFASNFEKTYCARSP